MPLNLLFFAAVAAMPGGTGSSDAARALETYLSCAEINAGGMCDNARTSMYTAVRGDDLSLTVFIPPSREMFVEVRIGSGEEKEVRCFVRYPSSQGVPARVEELEPMPWGLSLRSASVNAYYFHYGIGQHDCGLSASSSR